MHVYIYSHSLFFSPSGVQVSPESAALLQGREAGLNQQEELLALQGEYSACYETHDLLGKGAFGFVKSAQRKIDGLVVSDTDGDVVVVGGGGGKW